jgi:putative copper resistance protein D
MWVGGDGIMAAVMVVLVLQWLRSADRAPEQLGWLEQARLATFTAHTGAPQASSDTGEFDDDDAARTSYNAWLASLNRER